MSAKQLTLTRDSTALLVIDVQERINGVMADGTHVPRIALLMEIAQLLEIPVIATEQYPRGLGATIGELREFLPANTMEKDTFSCTRQPEVAETISRIGRKQILVVGIETHVCVLQTALDLVEAGYGVHVPHDGVNSRRMADKSWALQRMMAAGVIISSTESALFEMLNRCDSPEFKTAAKLLKKVPL